MPKEKKDVIGRLLLILEPKDLENYNLITNILLNDREFTKNASKILKEDCGWTEQDQEALDKLRQTIKEEVVITKKPGEKFKKVKSLLKIATIGAATWLIASAVKNSVKK